VWVEVFDPDLRLPGSARLAPPTKAAGALPGRAASHRWAPANEDGKAVWFEIPLDDKDA